MLSHALELSCPKTAECPIYIGPWVQGNKEVHLVPSQRSCIWLYLIVSVFDCLQFSSKSFITLSQFHKAHLQHLHCNDFGEKFWRRDCHGMSDTCLTPLDTSLLPCHMDLVGGPPSRAPESPSWRNLRLHRLHSLDSFWLCFLNVFFYWLNSGSVSISGLGEGKVHCWDFRTGEPCSWWKRRLAKAWLICYDLFDAGIPNIGYEISRLDMTRLCFSPTFQSSSRTGSRNNTRTENIGKQLL